MINVISTKKYTETAIKVRYYHLVHSAMEDDNTSSDIHDHTHHRTTCYPKNNEHNTVITIAPSLNPNPEHMQLVSKFAG